MRTAPLLAAALIVSVVLLLPNRDVATASRGIDRFHAAEVIRLRAHFDSVDRELRPAHPSIGDRRTEVLGWLREYRNAGAFPRNDRFDSRKPYFRDSRGTLCAVAYLVARSGRSDLVDRIARTRNNAYVRELSDDPEVVRWLESVGLTVTEAARVQPDYPPDPSKSVTSGNALASIALSGAAMTTAAFNLFSPSILSGLFGLTVGTVDGLYGLRYSLGGESVGEERIGKANLLIGSAAIVLGIRGLVAAGKRHQHETASIPDRRAGPKLTFTPSFLPGRRGPEVGLLIQARF